MEASKCPKCGDEPHFVEQVEKWYCYGCNSYVEEEQHHATEEHGEAQPQPEDANEIAKDLKALEEDEQQTCTNCGASMDKMQDGKLVCLVCESSPGNPAIQSAAGAKPEPGQNEAQALLDSITVATPLEPLPESACIEVPESKKEPPPEIKMCKTCGQPLKYIEKYQRYYCYGCRKYAPKESPDKQPTSLKSEAAHIKNCPDCGKELRYVEKYSEFYCYTCKKYPLRAKGKSQTLKCPKCGECLRFIEKYSRHYCIACKEYAPKGYGHLPAEKKFCPFCREQMRFVSEYNEWYCFRCKKYSLRPSKPVLLI